MKDQATQENEPQGSAADHVRNSLPQQETAPTRHGDRVARQSTCAAKVCAATSRWLLTIAYICEAIVLMLLLLLSLITTCTFLEGAPADYGPKGRPPLWAEAFDYHIGPPSFLSVIGIVVLFGLLLLIAQWVSHVRRGRLLAFLLIAVTVLQIVWIAALGLVSYHYPDSLSLIDGASSLLSGEPQRFAPDYCRRYAEECANRSRALPTAFNYLSLYPFQSGPMLWFALVGAVFGANNIIALQILNAFAMAGLVAALWRLGNLYGLDETGRASFAGLILGCVPLMMLAAFVYPNAVGFAITVAGVTLVAQAFRARSTWGSAATMIGGFLVCAVGVTFKSTFVILMLAAFIAIVLVVLRNRRWWLGLLGAVCLYGAHMLTKVPLAFVERITGQDFGKGLPMSTWVMLGLDVSPSGSSGWWTGRALHNFDNTSGDYAAQNELANSFIADRMHHLAGNPGEGARFFVRKLASEWSEPTFMTNYYSTAGTSSHHFSGLPMWLLAGGSGARLVSFENAMQSLVYMFALIGVIVPIVATFRAKRAATASVAAADPVVDSTVFARTFLAAAFLGGFICYVFWEAKGIYTLPFYLLLMPPAAYGVQCTLRGVKALWARRRPAHHARNLEPEAATQSGQ